MNIFHVCVPHDYLNNHGINYWTEKNIHPHCPEEGSLFQALVVILFLFKSVQIPFMCVHILLKVLLKFWAFQQGVRSVWYTEIHVYNTNKHWLGNNWIMVCFFSVFTSLSQHVSRFCVYWSFVFLINIIFYSDLTKPADPIAGCLGPYAQGSIQLFRQYLFFLFLWHPYHRTFGSPLFRRHMVFISWLERKAAVAPTCFILPVYRLQFLVIIDLQYLMYCRVLHPLN